MTSLPLFQPFQNEWLTMGLFFVIILTLIGISEWARIRLHVSPDSNRKLVHVLVGVLITLSPFIFRSNLPPILLAILFMIINGAALQLKLFSGMHTTIRKTYGTITFPLAYLVLCLFWWDKPITLVIAMMIMIFGDTIASLVGSSTSAARVYTLWAEKKSVKGSFAMFLATLLIVYILTDLFAWAFQAAFYLPLGILIGVSVFVAGLATLAEAASIRGSDNFSVPLVSAIAYDQFLINYTHGTLYSYLGWVLLLVGLVGIAYYLKTLQNNGAVGAFLIGSFIVGSGGPAWIIPLFLFFISSSLLSKVGNRTSADFQKGSQRDITQVLANGGLATLAALFYFYEQPEGMYIIFLGIIAAATADTWATEFGYFSRRSPRHILTFQQMEKGQSGGVTMLGTFGSLLGAFFIGLIGFYYGLSTMHMLIVTTAGFMGSLADSILGGTIQAQFVCSECNTGTEKRTHCSQPTQLRSGVFWIDNDMVNFINTGVGAILTGIFLRFF